MARVSTRSRRQAVVRSSIALVAVAVLPLVQPGCGSEDSKKKSQNGPRFMDGGEGGGLSSGGSSSPGDEGGTGGTSGNGGTAGTGNAGSAAGPGEGGGAGTPTGSGGEAGGGSDEPSCPAGTADCDTDPSDCETDVTQFDECGACGVACQSVNGTTICGETGCEVTSCTGDYGDCENAGTDGCETLLTSTQNCGFCDRNCGTQTCTNKLCDPALLGAASGLYRWARTADALYHIKGATPSYGLASNYTVTRKPLNGGADVVMHSDAKNPGGLAVDDGFVYWAVNGTPPAVVKKAHDAAAVTTPTPVFEPVSLPVQMAIQSGYMYWTNAAGAIFRRSMSAGLADGGSEIVSAAEVRGSGTFQIHQDLVVSPTAMYWVVPTTGVQAIIRTAPITGGAASDVAGATTNEYQKLSLVGEDLYWIRATGSALDGAYHYAPGGSVELLVQQASLNAVLAAGDYLYLLGGSNTLYRSPIAGGNSTRLGISNGLAYAFDFGGSDASNVYVLTSFTHGAGFFTNTNYDLLGYPL